MPKSIPNRIKKLELIYSERLRNQIDGYPDPLDENLIWPSKEVFDDYEKSLFKSIDLQIQKDEKGADEAAKTVRKLRGQTVRIGPAPPRKPISNITLKTLKELREDLEQLC